MARLKDIMWEKLRRLLFIPEPSMVERLNKAHEEHICSLREQLRATESLARRVILGPEISSIDATAKMVPAGRPQWREIKQKLENQHRVSPETKARQDYWEKKAVEVETEVGLHGGEPSPPDLSKELTKEAAENAIGNIRAS